VFSVPRYCTQSVSNYQTLFFAHVISFNLKIEATRSSETSVYNKPTRRHIQEDNIVHGHRRENLKSYTACVKDMEIPE
jgi:hypothetical protein